MTYDPALGCAIAVTAAEAILADLGQGVPPTTRDRVMGYLVAIVETAIQSYVVSRQLGQPRGLFDPSRN